MIDTVTFVTMNLSTLSAKLTPNNLLLVKTPTVTWETVKQLVSVPKRSRSVQLKAVSAHEAWIVFPGEDVGVGIPFSRVLVYRSSEDH
jgi:hypothetical protein